MKKFITLLLLFLAGGPIWAQDSVTDTLNIGRQSAQSPADLLRGRISGVRISLTDGNPNGFISTQIRGLNSLRGDSQPLWIVDGVILGNGPKDNIDAFWQRGGITSKGDIIPDYSGLSYTSRLNDLAFLDPYTIENITVLKDISETALYGAQGADGIILISTRMPAEERLINIHSNLAWNFSGFGHNHSASIGGKIKQTSYNVSGYFRHNDYSDRHSKSDFGGISLGFRSEASAIIQFGLNSSLTVGKQSSAAGAAYFGRPSLMMLERYPSLFPYDTKTGWVEDYDDDTKDYRTLISAFVNVKLSHALLLRVNMGADFQNNTRYIWYGEGTSFGKENAGAASVLSSALLNANASVNLEYNRYFASRHHLKANISGDVNGYYNKYGVINGTSFELPYLRAHGVHASGSRSVPYRFTRSHLLAGTYLSAAYDYNSYAGINALVRVDFSPKYGNQPMIYPAASIFTDFKKILLPDNKFVSDLKLTAGWGKAGKEISIPYELLYKYQTSFPEAVPGTAIYYDGLGRINSNEWNVGLQTRFWDKRIFLSAKWYHKTTSDDFDVWFFGKHSGNFWTKAHQGQVLSSDSAILNNTGFEFDAEAEIFRDRLISWTVRGNLSLNQNKMDGMSVATITGFRENSDGSPEDINGDGALTDSDKVPLGFSIPKLHGGFGTKFSVKDFTLDIQFDGAAGHQIANLSKLFGDGKQLLSASYVENGDFLRLSRVSAMYDIRLKRTWIKALGVSLSANNLFTAGTYSGWNPDVNCYGVDARSAGTDYGSFPISRSLILGISAKF